jgi:hypothetical protein
MLSLFFANRFGGLLTLYHPVLFVGVRRPGALLGGVAAAAGAIFLGGYAVFNRYKSVFAEVV